ncbi:hypothetical protein [Effusibacillus lacus]|uniref:Uncharacterized protein n=1 Tax=Effusibacillus lacus TaxID=1348429 RepID=A0A292YU25_9BACL|nr:hypothetical protein [Effusibacillus lacus]TCS73509.1 hypothetical protein EDD64_11816 [Effusibacillus lacus]GAX91995.1 hypothetical protein EFBL_3686 [Effusibacillus lacus]
MDGKNKQTKRRGKSKKKTSSSKLRKNKKVAKRRNKQTFKKRKLKTKKKNRQKRSKARPKTTKKSKTRNTKKTKNTSKKQPSKSKNSKQKKDKEELLEYAVPLNTNWNTLSPGDKLYNSLFSFEAETPNVWMDPLTWNIVYAAVPTGYSIPDPAFINVLSQRVAWNLLQPTISDNNSIDYNRFLATITHEEATAFQSEMKDSNESTAPPSLS